MSFADHSDWPSPTRLFKFFGLYGDRPPPQAAMRRGRLVDEAANLMALGDNLNDLISEENGRPWREQHPECEPYLVAMQRFLDEHTIIVHRHQVEVVNQTERYRGRFDWDAEIDGMPAYVDLKTSLNGTIPEFTGVQVALYAMAEQDRRKRRFGLSLGGNGLYRMFPFNDPRDFGRGLILVRAWWVAQHYRREK